MKPLHRIVCAVAVLCLGGCQTTSESPISAMSTEDGLVRTDVKGIQSVYKRPGVNLATYDKILLRPLIVEFAKNWQPERDGGSALYEMNPPDRERIKKDLADAFYDVSKRVLQEQGGYRFVTEPAADVLEVQPAIVNIFITAPDVSRDNPGIVRTYTANAGEMTLIAELHDSVTGQLLARAYDRREDNRDMWQWTTSVSNTADARRVIGEWANQLRKALDASRGKTG